MNVAVLHPGAMGIAIATSVQRSGATVNCVLHQRSDATIRRAQGAKLTVLENIERACLSADVIISVCPPHAAVAVAHSVAENSYKGLYVDANAISPERSIEIGHIVTSSGARFVDGGIVGGPPAERNQCFLYLSGESKSVNVVSQLFTNGLIEARIVSTNIGDASALKMCYAAYTKGSTAMLLAIVAAARNLGVQDHLFAQWEQEGSNLDTTAIKRAAFVPNKAWRWIDEMEQIAATFESAGVPNEFHLAAAEVYRRIQHLRPLDSTTADATDVIDAIGKNRG